MLSLRFQPLSRTGNKELAKIERNLQLIEMAGFNFCHFYNVQSRLPGIPGSLIGLLRLWRVKKNL